MTVREDGGQASVGARAGSVIEPRNLYSEGADTVRVCGRQHRGRRYAQGGRGPHAVKVEVVVHGLGHLAELLPTEGSHHRIDGLCVSAAHGVVIFQMVSDVPRDEDGVNELVEQQDVVYAAILSKLSRTPQLLKRRQLAVPIHIVSFVIDDVSAESLRGSLDMNIGVDVAYPESLEAVMAGLSGVKDPSLVEVLNAAVERVLTIKPRKKRANVKRAGSRGATMKTIERQIANLDRDQKRGAIECPEGPQRIRGLAGSGKTIVIALKAAYLHAEHPEWEPVA